VILADDSFESARQRLLALLRLLAYERRDIVLTSGRHSNFFIDAKQAVLTAEGHFLAGWLIHRVLVEKAPEVSAIGGLTMGADPLASAASTVSFLGARPLHAFYIRKEPKAHGTQKWIEGDKSVPSGTRVAILEDVVTTGGSTLKAIERARLHGLEVRHVVALVDREEGGRDEIEKEAPLTALFRRSEF
jgi:orotate phosphoribosyltransferase